MKLYLSSRLIPRIRSFRKFIGKSSNIKMGLIFNSKDYKSRKERREKLQKAYRYFARRKIKAKEINLLKLNQKQLSKELRKYDVLWFAGGNTYCLRWAMKKSGCDKVLKQVLKEGIVYAGDSAGAVIVGQTLKYYDLADGPKVAPRTIYQGLKFIDFCILPHWGSKEYGHILGKIKSGLTKMKLKTVKLTDKEWLLVDTGKVELNK